MTLSTIYENRQRDRQTDREKDKMGKRKKEKQERKKKCVKTEKGNGKKIKIKAEICEEHSTQKIRNKRSKISLKIKDSLSRCIVQLSKDWCGTDGKINLS